MHEECLIEVSLPTTELAQALATTAEARLEASAIRRDGRTVSIRSADERGGRHAELVVTRFVVEHRLPAEVTVRRRDSEVGDWREDRRRYKAGVAPNTPAGDGLSTEPEPPRVIWVDVAPLLWEARVTFIDAASAEAAAERLDALPDTVYLRREDGLAIYAASEGAAHEVAAGLQGLGSVTVCKLSRVQRWLIAQRTAGNYGEPRAASEYDSGELGF